MRTDVGAAFLYVDAARFPRSFRRFNARYSARAKPSNGWLAYCALAQYHAEASFPSWLPRTACLISVCELALDAFGALECGSGLLR